MFFPTRFRVLVVDDNRDAAESLAAILQLRHADVRVCFDGSAALAEACQFRPDAAILDLNMPGMDGFTLADELRRRLGPAMLLVALTGASDDDTRRRSQNAGFDTHLVKAGDLSDLDQLLAKLGTRALSGSSTAAKPEWTLQGSNL